MPYHVLGGPTKDSEFELYLEALSECGVPAVRDADGRLGVVDSPEMADQILKAVRKRVRWLPWHVFEVPVESEA